MDYYLQIAKNDETKFVIHDETGSLSCRVCRLSDIRLTELEVKYHILGQEHAFRSLITDVNDDDKYESASYMIEQHGRILLDTNDILSERTNDEKFFNGILEASCEGKSTSIGSLAVRVLDKTIYLSKNISREKNALEMTQAKENIVDLVALEEDEKCYYIAYRQCFTSLRGLLIKHDWKTLKARRNYCLESILLDAARGLWQLHNNSIQYGNAEFLHRNIRPQNILIYEGSERYVAKISNLLMSKPIEMGALVQSGSRIFARDGYTAPELTHDKSSSMTKAVDIFSLGCTIFYALSDGHDLFMANSRSGPIWRDLVNCASYKKTLAKQLISWMIQINPSNRPSISDVIQHPFFWNSDVILKLIINSSDLIMSNRNDQRYEHFLKTEGNCFYDGDWRTKIDDDVYQALQDNSKSLILNKPSYLLRAIRNLDAHCKEDPMIRDLLKWQALNKYNFIYYWLNKFPKLFFETFRSMQFACEVAELREFYTQNYDFNRGK